MKLSNGDLLLTGRRATGYSKAEDEAEGVLDLLPFSTEDEIRRAGGDYQKAAKLWEAFAIRDGRIVTGQNPASGGNVADLLLEALSEVE